MLKSHMRDAVAHVQQLVIRKIWQETPDQKISDRFDLTLIQVEPNGLTCLYIRYIYTRKGVKQMNNTTTTTKSSSSLWKLALIVPLSCIATPLLAFLLQKLANLLYASSASVALITAAVLFVSSLLVKICKPLQPKGKFLRGLVMAICACPWVVRAIVSCVIAVFGTYLMGFWAQNLANFMTREVNITAILMSAGMYLFASGKVPFAKQQSADQPAETEPEVQPKPQSLEELSEELGEALSADVADELVDDFTDDEVLP